MIVRAETLPTTAEEFLQWPDSEGREFVDGHPTERSGMGSRAGAIAGMIYFLLMLWNKGRGGFPLPGGDVGYQCFTDDPERVRKPDVSFIRAGRLSGNTVPEGWIQIVPDLVVEVLSPTDVWAKTAEKIAEYRAAGIPLIWIVDPVLEQVHVHRSPAPKPISIQPKRPESTVFSDRDGNRIGLTSGLRITSWYNEVFDAVRAGAPFTDEMIAEAVRAEFPNRPIWQTVAAYRSYYNSGKHKLGVNNQPLPKEERAKAYKPDSLGQTGTTIEQRLSSARPEIRSGDDELRDDNVLPGFSCKVSDLFADF